MVVFLFTFLFSFFFWIAVLVEFFFSFFLFFFYKFPPLDMHLRQVYFWGEFFKLPWQWRLTRSGCPLYILFKITRTLSQVQVTCYLVYLLIEFLFKIREAIKICYILVRSHEMLWLLFSFFCPWNLPICIDLKKKCVVEFALFSSKLFTPSPLLSFNTKSRRPCCWYPV